MVGLSRGRMETFKTAGTRVGYEEILASRPGSGPTVIRIGYPLFRH